MVGLELLLLFMIIGALIAVGGKDLLSSVIALGTVGLGLSLTFLILKAPDLAIAQLVVEILCVIILIRATIRKDLPFSTSGRWFLNTFITFIFIVIFSIFGYFCLKELTPFGYPTMRIASSFIANGLKLTGATNLVSSVVLDYRAYDTLGEATILFTAVIGVLAVMRNIGRKK
ncbi:MAG: hydrogen gas-evolving membrane-bound hydrogenase subunit E [Candidatus Omnitrophota bacterium]